MTAAVLVSSVSVAETQSALATAEADVLRAWDRLESLTCDIHASLQVHVAEMKLPAKGTGAMAYLKGGGRPLMHMALSGALSVPAGDTTADMPLRIEGAMDHSVIQVLTSALWSKNVIRADAPSTDGSGGAVPLPLVPMLFETLHEDCNLSLERADTVGGVPAHVFRAELKDRPSGDDAFPVASFRLCFARESGALLQVMAHGLAGERLGILQFSNLKTNAPLDPEKLRFVPPAEAQLFDLRGGKPFKAEYLLPAIPGITD